jgi:hypothetical protein
VTGDEPASADRGWELLRNQAYLPPDFDQEIYDSLWTVWGGAERDACRELSLPKRRRVIADHYGLVVDPASTDGDFRLLGYVRTPAGWSMNCLACHGGVVNGEVIPGLGNSRTALQSLTEDVRKIKLLRFQRLGHLDLAILKLPLNTTNGTTNSVIFGVVLGALRNPDMSVDRSHPVPKLVHHDMDAPPWWRLAKKSRLYADGFAPKNHRTIMQFMMLPENGRETFLGWEDDFRHILKWMESVSPPKFPKSIDTDLADRGRAIFRQRCADCHGTYEAPASYPEKRIPIDVVGTDRVRLDALSLEHREWMQKSWMSHFGVDRVDLNPDGYLAPPLDGIWASAPFLHNGSVPTLEHLLNSKARPNVWRRAGDEYDFERMGLKFEAFEVMPADLSTQDRRWYFDATLHGKSNAGHTFGDDLTGDERRAVIEYLKTL